mgnify:CR=1 FL=1
MGFLSVTKNVLHHARLAYLFSTIEDKKLVKIIKTLLAARYMESKVAALYGQRKIRKWGLGGLGQEAGPSVICSLLETKDWLIPPYRGLAHVIGKGLPLKIIAAEILGKKCGPVFGRGNPGNFTMPELGIFPNSDILGNNFSTAVGMGLSSRYKEEQRIISVFFGDGTATRSVLYGALNLSALWRLPIFWVCENNKYSVSTPVSGMTVTSFHEKARAFGVCSEKVDGNDIGEIVPCAERLMDYVRNEQKPAFLELDTYRIAPHDFIVLNDFSYQDKGERDRWAARDPLDILSGHIRRLRLVPDIDIRNLSLKIAKEVDEAFTWAAEQEDFDTM